jgi:hypothetical protein
MIYSIKKTFSQSLVKISFLTLFIGFLLVFIGNFFGIDLSDEGLAVLGFMPKQNLGINFTHYQVVVQSIFPNGISFLVARQLRLLLIVISGIILLISIYHSELKKIIRVSFTHVILLIGATTLISLGTGIQVLSYNGLNQFMITLYVAFLIQYWDKINTKNSSLFWLVLLSICISPIYLIRLPSFIPFIILHFTALLVINLKNLKSFLRHSIYSSILFYLIIVFLGVNFISISSVFSDVYLFAKMSSEQTDGHGFRLVFRYLYDFVQKFAIIFFASISYYSLSKYLKTFREKWFRILSNFLLLTFVFLSLISYPISISSFAIFLFLMIIISYYGIKSTKFSILKELDKISFSIVLIFFAVASTIGSNVWIINLSLFYLSIWAVASLFFISKKNYNVFKNVTYLLVFLAFLKIILTAFILPHRQGSLLTPHQLYETKNRGSIFLDKDMYLYITEIRSYLELQNLYEKDIVAVSRLPGLVYLLDSHMPGSINFTDAYWKVYCESLSSSPENRPVVIFRGNIPIELIECLADKDIDLESDYVLGKTIKTGFSKYKMPTYVYIEKEK